MPRKKSYKKKKKGKYILARTQFGQMYLTRKELADWKKVYKKTYGREPPKVEIVKGLAI